MLLKNIYLYDLSIVCIFYVLAIKTSFSQIILLLYPYIHILIEQWTETQMLANFVKKIREVVVGASARVDIVIGVTS